MCHSVNTWLQVNDIEVVTYLHICLEAYIVINQQNLRNRAGRYDPAIDFTITCSYFQIANIF